MSVTLLLGNCLPFMSQGTALAATEYKYQYQRDKQAKQARNQINSDDSDKPNILVIMGDDIGWYNISAYNNGIMGYKTPSIDSIAKEGVLFTDFYGEQSCTAGRAAFITGQATIRTGMTKVGLPGVDIGLQKEDPTLAELLKPLGYRTGQFGKNHLGDLDKYLPTNHGFDEFYGNLYHLNAEEEPEHPDYPEEGVYPAFDQLRPRGVLHSYSTDNLHPCETGPVWEEGPDVVDKTITDPEDPNYTDGQRICDTGPLTKKRMETVDSEVLGRTEQFIADANEAGEPFLAWFNTTRMHIYTHLKDESEGQTGLGIEADGMVEHDAQVGELLRFIDEQDEETGKDTIVIYTTDNGAEAFSWPDGGTTPFRSEKNSNWEGGFRVPAMIRWRNHIPAGVVSNEIMTHLDWVPTLMAAAGVYDIQGKLLEGYQGFNVHLDGYNFLPYLRNADDEVASSTSENCKPSKQHPANEPKPLYCPPRDEFIYFTDDGYPSALRLGDWKWVFSEMRGEGFDVWQEPYLNLRLPKLVNLRRDPFEKADYESGNYDDWRAQRLFLVGPAQLYIAKLLDTFVEYPPRQKPASFGIGQIVDQVLEDIDKALRREKIADKLPMPLNSSVIRLQGVLNQLRNIGAD